MKSSLKIADVENLSQEEVVIRLLLGGTEHLEDIDAELDLDQLAENLMEAGKMVRDAEEWTAVEELAELKARSTKLFKLCEFVEAIQSAIKLRREIKRLK
jgi:hypothetical protein